MQILDLRKVETVGDVFERLRDGSVETRCVGTDEHLVLAQVVEAILREQQVVGRHEASGNRVGLSTDTDGLELEAHVQPRVVPREAHVRVEGGGENDKGHRNYKRRPAEEP